MNDQQLAGRPTDLLLHWSQSCDGKTSCASCGTCVQDIHLLQCPPAKCLLRPPCVTAWLKIAKDTRQQALVMAHHCCTQEVKDEPAVVEGADNCSLAPPTTGVAPVGVEAEGTGPLLTAAAADGTAAGVGCRCCCC